MKRHRRVLYCGFKGYVTASEQYPGVGLYDVHFDRRPGETWSNTEFGVRLEQLVLLCFNCDEPLSAHVNDKCLFESTRFE